MPRIPSDKESAGLRVALGAGLIGIAIAAMSQMVSIPVDQIQASPLRLGILFFSAGIPLIALDLYATYCEVSFDYTIKSRGRQMARFLGFWLHVAGLDTLFWHFDVLAGWASLLVGGIALYSWRRFYNALRAAQNEK